MPTEPNVSPIVPNNTILVNLIRAKISNYFGLRNFHPLVTETIITASQVLNLRATPIQIAAPPGPGLILDLESVVLILKYGGTNPFTGAQNLEVRNASGAGTIVSQVVTGAGFIDQSGNMRTSCLPKVDQISTQVQAENVGLFLHNAGAAEITGNAALNNLLIVKCSYNVYSTEF